MPQGKSLVLAGLIWALAVVSTAARSVHGLTFASQSTYVASVEVVQHDGGAPPAFADGLRAVVLAEAALYGATGQAIILKIDLDKVHLKNPVKAMLIGDNNLAAGHVAVVDQASGQQIGSFAVRVDAERHRGVSVAMMLIGAFDPTGYVDVATTAASASSADIDRSGTQAAMGANFAAETLRQTFGDAKARAVHSATR